MLTMVVEEQGSLAWDGVGLLGPGFGGSFYVCRQAEGKLQPARTMRNSENDLPCREASATDSRPLSERHPRSGRGSRELRTRRLQRNVHTQGACVSGVKRLKEVFFPPKREIALDDGGWPSRQSTAATVRWLPLAPRTLLLRAVPQSNPIPTSPSPWPVIVARSVSRWAGRLPPRPMADTTTTRLRLLLLRRPC